MSYKAQAPTGEGVEFLERQDRPVQLAEVWSQATTISRTNGHDRFEISFGEDNN